MSKKKRSKQYKPKITCNPLGIRNHHQVEIPLLTAVSCLTTDTMTLEQVGIIGEYAVLSKRLDGPVVVDQIIDAVASIATRFDQTKRVKASDDEIKLIKEAIPDLMDFVRAQTNYTIVKYSLELINDMVKLEKKHRGNLSKMYNELR